MWLWHHTLVPESFARKSFCQPYISLFLRFFKSYFVLCLLADAVSLLKIQCSVNYTLFCGFINVKLIRLCNSLKSAVVYWVLSL